MSDFRDLDRTQPVAYSICRASLQLSGLSTSLDQKVQGLHILKD